VKSFLPKNLPGQLALVIAGALLVASAVNFVLLLGERQRAALAHLRALQRHYALAPYEPGAPTPMDELGEIAGVVLADGQPLVGAIVQLAGAPTLATDASGGFVFASVPPGPQQVTATADGFEPSTVEVTVAAMGRQTVTIELQPAVDAADDAGCGGCRSGGGGGSWAVSALALVRVRRRRAR
jgi:hypothetical protein